MLSRRRDQHVALAQIVSLKGAPLDFVELNVVALSVEEYPAAASDIEHPVEPAKADAVQQVLGFGDSVRAVL